MSNPHKPHPPGPGILPPHQRVGGSFPRNNHNASPSLSSAQLAGAGGANGRGSHAYGTFPPTANNNTSLQLSQQSSSPFYSASTGGGGAPAVNSPQAQMAAMRMRSGQPGPVAPYHKSLNGMSRPSNNNSLAMDVSLSLSSSGQVGSGPRGPMPYGPRPLVPLNLPVANHSTGNYPRTNPSNGGNLPRMVNRTAGAMAIPAAPAPSPRPHTQVPGQFSQPNLAMQASSVTSNYSTFMAAQPSTAALYGNGTSGRSRPASAMSSVGGYSLGGVAAGPVSSSRAASRSRNASFTSFSQSQGRPASATSMGSLRGRRNTGGSKGTDKKSKKKRSSDASSSSGGKNAADKKRRGSTDKNNKAPRGVPPPVQRGPQPMCVEPTRLPNGQRIKRPAQPPQQRQQQQQQLGGRRASRFASMRQLPGGVPVAFSPTADDYSMGSFSEDMSNGAAKRGANPQRQLPKTGPGAAGFRPAPPKKRAIKTTVGNDDTWMQGLLKTTWVDSPAESSLGGGGRGDPVSYKRKPKNHKRKNHNNTSNDNDTYSYGANGRSGSTFSNDWGSVAGESSSGASSGQKRTFVDKLKSLFS